MSKPPVYISVSEFLYTDEAKQNIVNVLLDAVEFIRNSGEDAVDMSLLKTGTLAGLCYTHVRVCFSFPKE